MAIRTTVSAPQPHLYTDESGSHSAPAQTAPPNTGTDYGLPVYASLGSSPIAVDQILSGAANLATGQVTLSSSSSTSVVSSRATRRSVLITNTDAAINIYIGVSGVTASTGQLIKAGNSLTIPTNAAVYAVAASGSPVVTFIEICD